MLFHVEDEGPGIPMDVRQLLFKAFVRGDSREDAILEHHGLGLAFVDLVAREHGGSVTVDCPSNGGSVFTLRLPIETPHFDVMGSVLFGLRSRASLRRHQSAYSRVS